MKPMSIHSLSQKEIAELLSVTPRTVRDWQEAGLPRLDDGRYDGSAVVQWRLARDRVENGQLDGPHARARKDKESADKLAMENRVRRGELIEAEEVQRGYGSLVMAARARLIQLPDSIAPLLPPASAAAVVARVRTAVYEALTDLANMDA